MRISSQPAGGLSGDDPEGGLIFANHGARYGTTSCARGACPASLIGTVLKLTPLPLGIRNGLYNIIIIVLYSFEGETTAASRSPA